MTALGNGGKIREIDPLLPEPERIEEAARIIQAGGVVIFPTKRLYGLGVDAENREAVEKIFRIKGRSEKNPLLMLVDERTDLERYCLSITPTARTIMEAYWPGDVTLVFHARPDVPEMVTGFTNKVGIRIPSHPTACALVKAVGKPVTGTSANISGKPGWSDPEAADPEVIEKVDLFISAGRLMGGIGSTVVDVTGPLPNVVREGAVPASDILKLFKKYE